jgi:hypothetical protein
LAAVGLVEITVVAGLVAIVVRFPEKHLEEGLQQSRLCLLTKEKYIQSLLALEDLLMANLVATLRLVA